MSAAAQAPSRSGLLHIGAVCRQPAATSSRTSRSRRSATSRTRACWRRSGRSGGYRLFDEDAVERLRTILRLQRDEFLPLRVIRQELASPAAGKSRRRRARRGSPGPRRSWTRASSCERSGATPQLLRELEEYGLLESRGNGGEKRYAGGRRRDRGSLRAALVASESGRGNLRPFRTAPTARRRCSSSSSGRRCGRATPSAARRLSTTCGRSPSSRRSSRSCSSGARSDSSPPADGRRRASRS